MCTISGYGATGPYQDLPSHGIAYDTWAGTIQPVVDDEGFCRIPDQANIGITAGPAFGAIGDPRRARARADDRRGRQHGDRAVRRRRVLRLVPHRDVEGRTSARDDEVTGNPSDDYERRPPALGGMWEGVRYQYYESSDGHILFMASEQAFWKNFCEGIDRMDLFEKWPGKKYRRPRRGNNRSSRRSCATSSAPEDERRSGSTFADEHNTHDRARATRRRRSSTTRSSRTGSRGSGDAAGADQLLFPLHDRGRGAAGAHGGAEGAVSTPTRCCAAVLGYDDDKIAALRAAGALGGE